MLSTKISSKLEFHGAAASSSPHSILHLPDQSVMYASNNIINIARPEYSENQTTKPELYNVRQTLRTCSSSRTVDSTNGSMSGSSNRSITCLAVLSSLNDIRGSDTSSSMVACAFSDGTLCVWRQQKMKWTEYVISGVVENQQQGRKKSSFGSSDDPTKTNCFSIGTSTSITNVDGMYYHPSTDKNNSTIRIMILTSSIQGVHCHVHDIQVQHPDDDDDGNDDDVTSSNNILISSQPQQMKPVCIANYATCTLKMTQLDNQVLLGVGSALPRSNRIHFYTLPISTILDLRAHNDACGIEWKHQGSVTGHLDWITCLDWTTLPMKKGFLLASGSQDARIRLWRFHAPILCDSSFISRPSSHSANRDYLNDSGNHNVNDDEEKDEEEDDEVMDEGEARMYIEYENENQTMVQSAVTLEALLIGHEEHVTSVAWRPCQTSVQCLISSSMDRSILIWMDESDHEASETKEGSSSQWVPITRVGTAGGILGGSIGSSLLGFVNVIWSQSGNQIIGHGYGGAIHFWTSEKNSDSSSSSTVERWRANAGITGHFRGCSDISWEITEGQYLLSVGLDQTCRLWSCLPTMEDRVWKELGRPQVHGYDLNTVVCIGNGNKELRHRFVSGADEKEARVFDATKMILQLLQNMIRENCLRVDLDERVERAFIPSLGLSNRAEPGGAMEEGDGYTSTPELEAVDSDYEIQDASKLTLRDIVQLLPHERDLGVTSLWPEIRKLYGHQSEMICLATNAARPGKVHGEVLVASSCKARDAEHAAIRIWDVNKNMCLDILKDGHQSTVVTMCFSLDSKYLISSGKDRRLCIWKRDLNTNHVKFYLSAIVESAHKRIVWSCDFCPVDPTLIVTASRDGQVKFWTFYDDGSSINISEMARFEPACKGTKKVEPVTAVAFAPKSLTFMKDGNMVLHTMIAIGMESGLIELWALPMEGVLRVPRLVHSIPVQNCHIDIIKKLAWRPITKNDELILASCSEDHGVRIFQVNVTLT